MSVLKLTKNELRSQQIKLSQLQRYLPTLKLKKAMLQSEVAQAKTELEAAYAVKNDLDCKLQESMSLLSLPFAIEWEQFAKIVEVSDHQENIAGVEIVVLDEVHFSVPSYSSFSSPIWTKAMSELIRKLAESQVECRYLEGKLQALERELREVSIRVNLFEKVLIPRAFASIKKIKIFLQDQELAAVGRAKVAKSKHRRVDLKEESYAG